MTQVGRAIEAGYRLFDTAQRYGNEAGVGRGLRAAAEEGKIKRRDVFVWWRKIKIKQPTTKKQCIFKKRSEEQKI